MNKDILKNLIENNTCSGNSTKNIVNYIHDYLSSYNFSSDKIPFEDSYSLLSLCDRGKDKWILFSGHLDTVPIGDLNQWKNNPFILTEDEDKYYGRGTCDMKGQIASILSLIPEMLENSPYNIAIALSCDEEANVKSVHTIIDKLKNKVDVKDIELCIVAEPTDNKVGISHQGIIIGNIFVQGMAGHSSDPKNGVNAIHYGIKSIEELRNKIDSFYNPNKISPSLNIGTFKAGEADNIIPENATIDFSIRTTAEDRKNILDNLNKAKENIEVLNKEIKTFNEKCFIDCICDEVIPPFICENTDIVKDLDMIHLPYGSEAGWLSIENINTIILGSGSIKQAHTVDEYIEKNSIESFENLLRKILI